MSFQGYQGKVNPQVGHEIPGAEERGQMMQLTQIQLAQIVSSAVSQVLTQHVTDSEQHTTSSCSKYRCSIAVTDTHKVRCTRVRG